MDINEIRVEKSKLEKEIFEFLKPRLDEFQKKTGLVVSDVDTCFDQFRLLDERRDYGHLRAVNIELEISWR